MTGIESCFNGENILIINSTFGSKVTLGSHSEVQGLKIDIADLDYAMIRNNAYFEANFTSINIDDYSELS